MKLIVGIDFGTSTTVVRYKEEGTDNIHPVKDSNGTSDVIPSAIFRMADHKECLYGQEALNASKGGMKGELITNFKMGLLESDEDKRKEKESQIKEFMCYIYKRFSQVTKGLNPDKIDVYVSYPAKWSDSFIDFMKEAVGIAGFGEKDKGSTTYNNIYGVNEPKAATYNMLHSHLAHFQKSKMLTSGKPMHVFMFDMGAGTTDIVIFRLKIDSNGKVEIDNLISYPTVDNPYLCGGREIDKILSDYIIKYVLEQTKLPTLDEDFFTVDSAKYWKDQIVSSSLKKNVNVLMPPELQSALKFMPNGKNTLQKFLFTRTAFETASESHWKNLYDLITSAMNLYKTNYQIGAEDIDLLFLTGGHSQWYTIPNLFNGEGVCDYIGKDYQVGNTSSKAMDFKKLREEPWRMFEDTLPHECVAKGLCLQDSTIKIVSVSTNNVWIKVEIGDQKAEPIQIASVGQPLPIQFKISPRASFNKSGLEKSVFNVSVELITGSDLENAKKAKLYQIVDNDDGRWVANLLLLGLPILFGGYDTTIEIPLTIDINEDNSIDINGNYLYANGKDTPTEKLNKLEKDGKIVTISKSQLKYE